MLRVIAHELHRALVDEIGEVAVAFHGLHPVAQGGRAVVVFVLVVIGVAEELAEILVEAALRGVELVAVAEMPFAEGARGVAGGLQPIRNGGLAEREAEAVDIGLGDPRAVYAARLLDHVAKRELKSDALLPAAGHEAGARGRAHGGIGVEIGKLHALGREAIDVGRLDVGRAHAAEVAVAEIIGEDEDDVRFRQARRGRGGRGGE